jgi:hypothetical protein
MLDFRKRGTSRYGVFANPRQSAECLGEVAIQEYTKNGKPRRHWNAFAPDGEMIAYGLQTRGAAASFLELRANRLAAKATRESV